MRGFIFALVILAVGFSVLMMIKTYQTESFRETSIRTAMKEAAEIALVSERDLSSRIDGEGNYLIKPDFEAKFKEVFKSKVDVKIPDVRYHFDYLDGVDEQIKAIKITVTDNKEISYKLGFVASNPE